MMTSKTNVSLAAYINGLRVITEPVSEVDALDIELGELLASASTGHENSKQGIFDITVGELALEFWTE